MIGIQLRLCSQRLAREILCDVVSSGRLYLQLPDVIPIGGRRTDDFAADLKHVRFEDESRQLDIIGIYPRL
jgi:hypothetical protein